MYRVYIQIIKVKPSLTVHVFVIPHGRLMDFNEPVSLVEPKVFLMVNLILRGT